MISALFSSSSSFSVDINVPPAMRPYPTRLLRSSTSIVTITFILYTTDFLHVPGAQLSVAEIFECIVGALPVCPSVDFAVLIDPRFASGSSKVLRFSPALPVSRKSPT